MVSESSGVMPTVEEMNADRKTLDAKIAELREAEKKTDSLEASKAIADRIYSLCYAFADKYTGFENDEAQAAVDAAKTTMAELGPAGGIPGQGDAPEYVHEGMAMITSIGNLVDEYDEGDGTPEADLAKMQEYIPKIDSFRAAHSGAKDVASKNVLRQLAMLRGLLTSYLEIRKEK